VANRESAFSFFRFHKFVGAYFHFPIPDFYGSTQKTHSKSSSVRTKTITSHFASLNASRLAEGMVAGFIAPCVIWLTSLPWSCSDGHYGLYLDDSLFEGSSAPCPTFDNEPLCSPGPKKGSTVEFECVGVEVWAMGP